MRILVTGGHGFIGSAVIRLAIARGHYIFNVDKMTYAACFENLNAIRGNPNYTFSQIDICDLKSLKKTISEFKPNAIIHLAAESHVDRSIDRPSSFIETNINGSFNMLEAALDFWVTAGRPDSFRFHHVSTDEVYGTLGVKGKFNEDTPYAPNNPYSASKAASDHLVRAWHETYALPVIITNCSNNYGPYQFPEKLIPVCILNDISGQPIPVYGKGQNVRDWLHVEDHADAILLALGKGKVGRTYNIGGENETKNIDIVIQICSILDKLRPNARSYKEQITFVKDRPGHDMRYAIDPKRMREELAWRPTVTFQEGLENTVIWYLENDWWWRALQRRHNSVTRLGMHI